MELYLILGLCLANLILLLVLLLRPPRRSIKLSQLEEKLDRLTQSTEFLHQEVTNLSSMTEYRLNNMQSRLSEDVKFMARTNTENLEKIRRSVDEQLTSTLEGKLNRSYQTISRQLETVYRSLGEMKALSESVSDIKKVFSNVKLRGTWGETQLSALLSQMLAPNQFAASVKLNPLDNTLVDFAVLMPTAGEEQVLLPIDSKFPVEEYRRLIEAEDRLDREGMERARKNLERAVKLQADSIAAKYILPPRTTDFAVMYLPLEGLYGEILKLPALIDYLQERRILVCGPTNLGALLSTLQLGFKTAAIEKRSGELWQLLSAFKREFEQFAAALEKTQKKLQEAQDSIEGASRKTRTIARKLKGVSDIDDETGRALLYGDETDET